MPYVKRPSSGPAVTPAIAIDRLRMEPIFSTMKIKPKLRTPNSTTINFITLLAHFSDALGRLSRIKSS